MVVRAQWRGETVDGLFWGCQRELVCDGRRKIRDPLMIQPTADAGTQAIYEWMRARDSLPGHSATASSGFLGVLGRAITRPTPSPSGAAAVVRRPYLPLDGLVDYGYVILDNRHVQSARAKIGHLVIGPTGVFVVDRKPWVGQLSASTDSVFMDGRQRSDATDSAVRATTAVEAVLAHELKPLGATVRPVISFDGATNRAFEAIVSKVIVAGSRSLAKQIRGGQPNLGPETVVRLSLAADRLLD